MLRELLTNAIHALDAVYFQSLRDRGALKRNPKKTVAIDVDPSRRTLTITDTGIGMTRADLINNLGALNMAAEPGFDAALASADVAELLRAGAGVYSGFVAAESLEVHTKHNDDDCYVWSLSHESAEFAIAKLPEGTLSERVQARGTAVVLRLREAWAASALLNEASVREMVQPLSESSAYPLAFSSDPAADEPPAGDAPDGGEAASTDVTDDGGELGPEDDDEAPLAAQVKTQRRARLQLFSLARSLTRARALSLSLSLSLSAPLRSRTPPSVTA